jgi:hypothetical protein
MEGQTLTARAEHALRWFYFDYLEPIHFVSRKHRRMSRFGIASRDDLPCGEVDLQISAAGCAPACPQFATDHRRYLGKYLFVGDGAASGSWLWRGVPLVIDLDRYADFALYEKQLKQQSKGAGIRQIRKARRLGFYCRPFDREQRRLDLYDIETSLRYRSGGPVVAAYLRRRPEAATEPAIEAEPPMPACLNHWYVDWGVFARPDNTDGGSAQGERLVGFMYLKRVGNIVLVRALMGHGAYMASGIVKLLFADVMKWLLDRCDPRVRGIRYLHYGAIEQGNNGLVTWKDRFQFQPCVFRWQVPEAAPVG